MAGFLFKLESEDGMPAKPSSVSSAGPNGCRSYDPFRPRASAGAMRDDEDSPPALVVEDAAG